MVTVFCSRKTLAWFYCTCLVSCVCAPEAMAVRDENDIRTTTIWTCDSKSQYQLCYQTLACTNFRQSLYVQCQHVHIPHVVGNGTAEPVVPEIPDKVTEEEDVVTTVLFNRKM